MGARLITPKNREAVAAAYRETLERLGLREARIEIVEEFENLPEDALGSDIAGRFLPD